MNINSVRFTCTALKGTGKKGVMAQDSNGYVDQVIGALNVFNSAGERYVAEGARDLFASNGLLMKRIQRGRLRGENGHPKQAPGESEQAFMRRIFMINESNVSTFFNEVYLDGDSLRDEKGQPIIAIRAKLKPYGPHAKQVQDAIDDPNLNLCYSIRAFTDDKRVGLVNHRLLRTIITWDQVGEPGISVAEKFSNPSLEGLHLEDEESRIFTRSQFEDISKVGQRGSEVVSVAQESAIMSVQELMGSMGWIDTKPSFLKW